MVQLIHLVQEMDPALVGDASHTVSEREEINHTVGAGTNGTAAGTGQLNKREEEGREKNAHLEEEGEVLH